MRTVGLFQPFQVEGTDDRFLGKLQSAIERQFVLGGEQPIWVLLVQDIPLDLSAPGYVYGSTNALDAGCIARLRLGDDLVES
jgi:hypothetical protein